MDGDQYPMLGLRLGYGEIHFGLAFESERLHVLYYALVMLLWGYLYWFLAPRPRIFQGMATSGYPKLHLPVLIQLLAR